MTNIVKRAIASISSIFQGIQVKSFLGVVLTGFLLLTTNVDQARNNQPLPEKIDQTVHQIDSTRPKTMNEWRQEARETENSPVERLKNIGEESAKAVQEFGGMYPDVAKDSTGVGSSNKVETGKNHTDYNGLYR